MLFKLVDIFCLKLSGNLTFNLQLLVSTPKREWNSTYDKKSMFETRAYS
jgi:hypothetical protein